MAEDINAQLAPHLIENGPPSMFYIPNFITAEEEEYILNKVHSSHTIAHNISTNIPSDPSQQMDIPLSSPAASNTSSSYSIEHPSSIIGTP
jgi:hypothetical protein